MTVGLGVVAILGGSGGPSIAADGSADALVTAGPAKDLSPPDVIRIQLAALAHNREFGKDRGIGVAWRFASPANKEVTGPEARFARMLKGGYGAMLNHKRSSLGELQLTAVEAKQVVLVEAADGQIHAYLWMLGLQENGPHRGCWMTDAVIELELEGDDGAEDEPPRSTAAL